MRLATKNLLRAAAVLSIIATLDTGIAHATVLTEGVGSLGLRHCLGWPKFLDHGQ